jgi:glycosyltransferase involved in cell wall biosynthesis
MVNRTKPGAGPQIIALGLRGIPNVPGGVETHAAELYPRLCALGANVTVLGRKPYRPAGGAHTSWNGVAVRWVWAPKTAGVEALVHSVLGVLYAAVRRPDVVHIHAVGPWLVVPLAKLFRLKVVVTHHGQDYLREKWQSPARAVLRLGERLGIAFADERIVISRGLLELVRSKYQRDATLIPNGIGDVTPAEHGLLSKHGLTPYRYIIQVSRLVPEKRQLDLIAAFNAAKLSGWKLLLVGGPQGSQHYADQVRRHCAANDDIINTGFLSAPEVRELLSRAGIFVLPSSHEGLPIALLEAMKLGTPVLASNIPANLEMGLDEASYFPLGDVAALAARLVELAALTPEARLVIAQRLRNACTGYDWDLIAESTLKVLGRAAGRRNPAIAPPNDRRIPPRMGASFRR